MRGAALGMGVLLATCTLVLGAGADRWRTARDGLESARIVAQRAAGMVAERDRLSALAPVLAVRGEAEDALPGRVTGVLVAAGLGADRFQRATMLGDVVVADRSGVPSAGGVVRRRQTASVQLRGLTVGELGRFLAAWRERQPTWIPARLEMRTSGPSPAGAVGGEAEFAVTLTMENQYVDTDR